MGPKKGGKKKTKAELEAERLIQEEEERKAHEADLKRQAEEAEKKRLEDLRIAEERKVFRTAELERLCLEYSSYLDGQARRDKQMASEQEAEDERVSWECYTNPSDEPDARSERDMNTFISLVTEQKANDIREALPLVENVIKVSKSVEAVFSEELTHNNPSELSKYRSYLTSLYDLCVSKLDFSTSNFLRFVDNNLNDKLEIHIEESTNNGLCIGMWAVYSDIRPVRKSVQFESMGFSIDIPKQILQQESRFVHRVIRMPIDKYSISVYDSSSTSREFAASTKYVVGDLYLFEILHTPPQAFSLRAKKWIIRDKSAISLHLRRSVYPSSVACRCTFRVSEEVVMGDDVHVAVWDEDAKRWSQEGISDYQFNETTRQAVFYLTVVGTIALVRERTADFPYKRWSVVPLYNPDQLERQNRLSISTQRNEVVIDIVGTKCKLVKPNTRQMANLLGVEMSCGELLFRLQRLGINLLPTNDDCSGVPEYSPKLRRLEEDVLRNMARCGSALEFSSTSWNQTLKSTEAGMFAKESTAYVGSVESFDNECILMEDDSSSESYLHAPSVGVIPGAGVKYTLVLGNEYGDKKTFSRQPRPGEITHAELYTCMKSRLTAEAIERIARVNPRFANALFMLMRLVRPLSLS